MGDWRYFATNLNGDGTETFLAGDLPLSNVSITDALSSPDSMVFDIHPEDQRLKLPTGVVFEPWRTAIYAETDNLIRHGSIVRGLQSKFDTLTIDTVGFSAFLNEQPWTSAARLLYQVDPADVIRTIWAEYQSKPAGNIGMVVSPDVKTNVKLGIKPPRVAPGSPASKNPSPTVEDSPVVLAPYATHDLGRFMGELMEAGSLDYRETHTRRADGTIAHDLVLASPRMGRRRQDIRFVVGTNVSVPDVDIDASDYASEVLLLGAGEAEKMIRGHAAIPNPPRLRRVSVRLAKHIGRTETANSAANARAKSMVLSTVDVEQLTVFDHPNAPLFSWSPGDEVRLVGETGWAGRIDQWVRVMGTTYSPDANTSSATLTVVRADKV